MRISDWSSDVCSSDLRKLEEMELRRERDQLAAEREGLVKLIESPARQRTRLKKDLTTLRERYGPETELGRRRTTIEEAAPAREIPLEAMIEREPVTIIMSQRGWIRAMKGHADLSVRSEEHTSELQSLMRISYA